MGMSVGTGIGISKNTVPLDIGLQPFQVFGMVLQMTLVKKALHPGV